MAYSELIKSFSRIRAYMRSFYVYGFRHRNDYDEKSTRGYDNERRRIGSWLGDYMSFGQDVHGRRVFLSVDSRAVNSNPLYRAFRTKSFTDRDIMLHFYLLDILPESEGMAIYDIMEELANLLNAFEAGDTPDESTVRKKLSEYVKLGIVSKARHGRETIYCRSICPLDLDTWSEAVGFFSEAAPLGVVGSYVQDLLPKRVDYFRFKHHYILNTLDSEILCELAEAINSKCSVEISSHAQHVLALPMRLYISSQTGRQYVLVWVPENERFSFWRLDIIDDVKIRERLIPPPDLIPKMREFQRHVWGVSCGSTGILEHLEMTIYAGAHEDYIVRRLEREKRGGTVSRVDDTHWHFSVDVYDTMELLPWIRTFTGRITDFKADNSKVCSRLFDDFDAMSVMYGGEPNAVP